MSGLMYGADADQLDLLAARFFQTADDLDGQGGALTGILNNISWLGDTAGQFLSDWTGVQLPNIGLSTHFLRETGQKLHQQAAQQRAASGSNGQFGFGVPGTPWHWGGTGGSADALNQIKGWLDTGGWGVTKSDLVKITELLASLTPEQRAEVLAGLSDAELLVLKDQMQEGRLKGGLSSAEQSELLGLLLPALSPDQVHLLMGPDWAKPIDGDLRTGGAPFRSDTSPSSWAAELLGVTGNEAVIPPDQIQIRKVGPDEYIVVLPGVTDLSSGLKQGALGFLGGGLLGGTAGLLGDWTGTNPTDSARDMNYAILSETLTGNGSVTGTNAYAFAVKQAMLAAGVSEGANVMLVGHSFGAYTAAELAGDPSFNNASGGGYNVTHVLAAGASAGFRMNDLPPGTQGLLVNNSGDAAYLGEATLVSNNEYSPYEVVFNGGNDGWGHHPTNYRDFMGSTNHPAVSDFRDSAFREYGGDGTHTRVTVKDPYRVQR